MIANRWPSIGIIIISTAYCRYGWDKNVLNPPIYECQKCYLWSSCSQSSGTFIGTEYVPDFQTNPYIYGGLYILIYAQLNPIELTIKSHYVIILYPYSWRLNLHFDMLVISWCYITLYHYLYEYPIVSSSYPKIYWPLVNHHFPSFSVRI
jgi:hypothetical protein